MNIVTPISKNIPGAILSLLTAVASASATSTCSQELCDCLLLQTPKTRATCFALASKRSACVDSPLGAISALRASVATLEGRQAIIPVTELGEATTANSECLRNFDNALASTLIIGEPSEGEMRRLAKTLRSCVDGSLNTSR